MYIVSNKSSTLKQNKTQKQTDVSRYQLCYVTTLKSVSAASSRNGTRIYPILLCHFMTENQKLRFIPETFRLSFYGIQGVPKKI